MRLDFEVDLQSDALQVLKRIMDMNTKPLLQNISKTLKGQAAATYRKAWGGLPKIEKANTVYAAVKKSLFGDEARRGLLTKSTASSIESGVEGDEAWAGVRGTWPKNWYTVSAPMDAVVESLEEVWGRESIEKRLGLGIQDKFTNRLAATRRTDVSLPGKLVMSWGPNGLKIQWPEFAKKVFGLKDMNISAEPYATKTFGRTGKKDLFYIAFVKDLMDDADVFLEGLINPEGARSGMGTSSISQEVQDLFNGFPGKYEDPFRDSEVGE